MPPKSVRVALDPPYSVRVVETFAEAWKQVAAFDRPIGMIVADRRVVERQPRVFRGLERRARSRVVLVDGGEKAKTMRRFEALHRSAIDLGMDRSSLVVAVGGGTVGDLTGFFASTWMRGVPWVPIATTSLSIADSAVGGKTAVNFGSAKNLVGTFHQPIGVIGVVEALASLSPRHRRSGLAEVLKAGIIADAKLFGRIVARAEELKSLDPEVWIDVLVRACRVKAQIVARDPREGGSRALLNFGHTIGHALEVAQTPRPTHGEAVALGMISASWVSERLDVAPPGTTEAVREAVGSLGLPRKAREIDRSSLWRAIRYDKKSRDGLARLVLTEGVGSATFGHAVPRKILQQSLSVLGIGSPGGASAS